MSGEQVVEVDVNKVFINPHQPRREFAEEELEELAQSIRSVGLLHPPLVRPLNQRLGTFELVSGERRLRASRRAGLKQISVVVKDVTSYQSAQAALVENLQRVDLNPIEVAEGFHRLVEKYGFTQNSLAEHMGKKRSTVANYLRLLALPENIQGAVSTGKISMGHAKAVLSLGQQCAQQQLCDLVMGRGLNVRETERLAKKIERGEKDPVEAREDPLFQEIAEGLQQALQAKVTIQDKGKGGTVAIHYEDGEQLRELTEKIARAAYVEK